MKIDCQIHEENQCLFICVAQSCTGKSRFLCSECITEQNEKHHHSMVSLSSLHKMDQSAQFKLLSFADPKKNIISNLKLQNVDEKVSKISSFYEKVQEQINTIIQARMQYEINECIQTACSSPSLQKQSRIEDLVQILNLNTSQGNQTELNKNVDDFFKEYHQEVHQVEKYLNNCISWDQKFSYVEDLEKNCKEIIFKMEYYLNKLSPSDNKNKNGLALEIVDSIKNEEILLPPYIKYFPDEQVFSKVDGLLRHYVGIIDIPITRDLLKTSFKVKIHKCKWIGIGVCERDVMVNRDYQGEFKLLTNKNGLWICTSNGCQFSSEEDAPFQSDSLVYFHADDVLIVTPFDYKIDYYAESNPNRLYSQKFTYDETKVYCPCFVFFSNGEDKIEFIQ